jgi:hypothetical protein
MVSVRIAAACALGVAATLSSPLQARTGTPVEKRELNLADAMSTVRVIENQLTLSERVDSGVTSPDGKRYLIRLVSGDPKRNGVWVDLMTGSLDSLESAARPRLCAHLFTTGLGSSNGQLSAESDPDATNLIHWVNDNQVAFLWSDAHAIRQVMSVDVTTCKPRFVTHSATDVFSFVFLPDGSLLFDAQVPRPADASQRIWDKGFTVGESSDGFSILKGKIDTTDVYSVFDNAWFIRSAGATRPIDIAGYQTDHTNPFYRNLFLSNTGRLALIDVGIAALPTGWQQYTNPILKTLLKIDQSAPGRLPLRYALIDLKSGASGMLWDAPRAFRGQVAWSPAGETLLLAPTYLPLDANNPLGQGGNAAAELDVRSGQYQILPVDLTLRTVLSTEWLGVTAAEIRSTNDLGTDARVDRFTREDGHWKVAAATDPAPGAPPRISLQTRQSLNDPPRVFAVDSASGESRLVLDPNPHLLDQFKLGRVERMSGTLSNGKQWIAQLTYPADYTPGIRYPLVIQSSYGHVFGPEEFTLNGTWESPVLGLGPTSFASMLGQLLATRNIAVLTLSVLRFTPGSGQDDEYQLAFESLAQQLVTSGLADPQKIALQGFSHNGHYIEFALAHSTFPYAAALVADSYDPSYFQSALSNWPDTDERMNGAPAFGDGLHKWMDRAVGFNSEHVHTPLLMIGQSAGTQYIISEWEIFSRLRHLKKPVEMYVMPEVNTHPAHLPQNPRQIMAIQDHAIDWLSFWLTGREDPSPDKQEQYARWRAFRATQTAAELRITKDP